MHLDVPTLCIVLNNRSLPHWMRVYYFFKLNLRNKLLFELLATKVGKSRDLFVIEMRFFQF